MSLLPITRLCKLVTPALQTGCSRNLNASFVPAKNVSSGASGHQATEANNGTRNLDPLKDWKGPTTKPFVQLSLNRANAALNTGITQLSSIFSRILISSSQSIQSHPTCPLVNLTISRNVVKRSMLSGRRKTVNAVKRRFYRLDWGGWISAQPGRARHLWWKPWQMREQLRHHILRDTEECALLDRMSSYYYIKKKHFVDDPYENYHTRDNFPITKGLQGTDTIILREVGRLAKSAASKRVKDHTFLRQWDYKSRR